MKYICLGYIDESEWEGKSESERNAFMDACFEYDDQLRAAGHFVGGEALQGPGSATMLRYHNGNVSVTDGPFTETKEYLGGIMMLEATDLNHAIQLMSRHPSIRMGGSWEIRPSADLSEFLRESELRRGVTQP